MPAGRDVERRSSPSSDSSTGRVEDLAARDVDVAVVDRARRGRRGSGAGRCRRRRCAPPRRGRSARAPAASARPRRPSRAGTRRRRRPRTRRAASPASRGERLAREVAANVRDLARGGRARGSASSVARTCARGGSRVARLPAGLGGEDEDRRVEAVDELLLERRQRRGELGRRRLDPVEVDRVRGAEGRSAAAPTRRARRGRARAPRERPRLGRRRDEHLPAGLDGDRVVEEEVGVRADARVVHAGGIVSRR